MAQLYEIWHSFMKFGTALRNTEQLLKVKKTSSKLLEKIFEVQGSISGFVEDDIGLHNNSSIIAILG